MPGDGPAKDLDLPSQTASWLISYNDYRLLRAAANTSSSNVEGGGDIEALALKLPKKRKLESAVSAEEMDILNLEEVGLIRYCDVIHVCFGDDAMRTACSEAAQRPPGIEKKHWRVAATAIAYFRRFYLVNSLVKFDPRTIMIACAYLAGKTEECRVGVTELLTVHPKATRDIVLAHERIIIQTLGFHLKVHHPQSSLNTLIADYKRVVTGAEKMKGGSNVDANELSAMTRQWRVKASQILAILQKSAAILVSTPVEMAVYALASTEKDLKSQTAKSHGDEVAANAATYGLPISTSEYVIERFGADMAASMEKARATLSPFIDTVNDAVNNDAQFKKFKERLKPKKIKGKKQEM